MRKSKPLKSVGIVGFGNVGFQLANFFYAKKILKFILVRDLAKATSESILLKDLLITDFDQLKKCDLVVVCVSDDAVNKVVVQIPPECIVVHSSGSVGLHQVDRKENMGVFYPLQTFSKERGIDLIKVPILIESKIPSIENQLIEFATQHFDKVRKLNSEQRKQLHLAAVFVNNFTNHLYFQAEEHLKKHQLDFDLLKPLILETAQKLQVISAKSAQTGPARRKDYAVVEAQKAELYGLTKEIYELLTESIIKTYEKL